MAMDLREFLLKQLNDWSLAAKNFSELGRVITRRIYVDEFPIILQHNPARIVSTGAKVDAKSIKERPCFLCKKNRPKEQESIKFQASRDYEILVNPFPLAPEHFTVAATEHINQDEINVQDMAQFIAEYPKYLAFYNGSTAGASAPDHLHFQACNKDFLKEITSNLEANPGKLLKQDGDCRIYMADHLPMNLVHFVDKEVSPLQADWLKLILPTDDYGHAQAGMRNILMWKDCNDALHTALLPRCAHRPDCYFTENEAEKLLVSPGAIDMAGVIILPRKEDFDKITAADVRSIYNQVSLYYPELPSLQRAMLL